MAKINFRVLDTYRNCYDGFMQIKGKVSSIADLPKSGMENGDVYLVNGSPYFYNGEDWGAMGGGAADWSVNDSSASGYVANRTHYKESLIVHDVVENASLDIEIEDYRPHSVKLHNTDKVFSLSDIPFGADGNWELNTVDSKVIFSTTWFEDGFWGAYASVIFNDGVEAHDIPSPIAIELPEWTYNENGYSLYETVTYNNKNYISLINNNTYTPGVQGWGEYLLVASERNSSNDYDISSVALGIDLDFGSTEEDVYHKLDVRYLPEYTVNGVLDDNDGKLTIGSLRDLSDALDKTSFKNVILNTQSADGHYCETSVSLYTVPSYRALKFYDLGTVYLYYPTRVYNVLVDINENNQLHIYDTTEGEYVPCISAYVDATSNTVQLMAELASNESLYLTDASDKIIRFSYNTVTVYGDDYAEITSVSTTGETEANQINITSEQASAFVGAVIKIGE